jgi:glycerol-3-phosphate dehydrogenase
LSYALHATTMNRDRDPAADDDPIEFDAFDAGVDAGGAGVDGDEGEGDAGGESRAAADGGRPTRGE